MTRDSKLPVGPELGSFPPRRKPKFTEESLGKQEFRQTHAGTNGDY